MGVLLLLVMEKFDSIVNRFRSELVMCVRELWAELH